MLFARSYLRDPPPFPPAAPWYLDANVAVRSRVPAGFLSFPVEEKEEEEEEE